MQTDTWKPLPLLNSYVDRWKAESPDAVAMIQFETGEEMSYRNFADRVDDFAVSLLDMGISKGDVVATMLFTDIDHLCLMYACFKLGAIVAPLDVRLKEAEVIRDIRKIEAKAFFFLGETPMRNFSLVGKAVRDQCPYSRNLLEVSHRAQAEAAADGFVAFSTFADPDRIGVLKSKPELVEGVAARRASLVTDDGCLIIYTTGSAGEPKPALLSHRCIIAQDEILARISNLPPEEWRILCNLPTSHVAGTTEGPFTSFYVGGTAVLTKLFTPVSTLEAIRKHRVTAIGMVPTQYRMLWALPDYANFDLSSVKVALYGGAAVDLPFLTKMARMAKVIGGGLGMTESAGWATCHPPGIDPAEMVGQVGRAFPDVARVSVRKPMNADGTAGDELQDGEAGEICYHPPLVFLGYFGMPEETARTISSEGILYTGDLGFFKDMGSYRGLVMSGRRKFMIKQKGYNVSPEEVEAHVALHPKVAEVCLVGVFHSVFDEGIFAFVKPHPGVELTADEIDRHYSEIAAYKRPQHVELWPSDKLFPMNRLGKLDRQELKALAEREVEKLRETGKWDARSRNSFGIEDRPRVQENCTGA